MVKEKLLIRKIFTNDILYFIYLLILDNHPTLLDINENLIRAVESCYVTKLHFNYNILANIPHKEIIDKLYQILLIDKIDNNFHIYYKNNHIEVAKFINDELVEYINSKK